MRPSNGRSVVTLRKLTAISWNMAGVVADHLANLLSHISEFAHGTSFALRECSGNMDSLDPSSHAISLIQYSKDIYDVTAVVVNTAVEQKPI